MDWLAVTMFSACGGAIVQVIDLAVAAKEWQKSRHRARISRETLPPLAEYVDMGPDSLVFLTRLALGAITGLVFHGQVDGVSAAVAVGASAPALLKQLGGLHSLSGLDQATVQERATSMNLPTAASVTTEEG